jgi:hypothetical protein
MKIENKLVVVGTFSVHKECNDELCAGQTSLTLIEFIANSNDIYVSNRKFGNKLVVVGTNVFEAPRTPSQCLGICGGRLGDAIHTLVWRCNIEFYILLQHIHTSFVANS